MKPTVVVANTSPLIALAVMNLLPVLNTLFETVLVPPAVVAECLDNLSKPKADIIIAALSAELLTERAAHAVANREKIPCIGSLYVLIKAKQKKLDRKWVKTFKLLILNKNNIRSNGSRLMRL